MRGSGPKYARVRIWSFEGCTVQAPSREGLSEGSLLGAGTEGGRTVLSREGLSEGSLLSTGTESCSMVLARTVVFVGFEPAASMLGEHE